MPKTKIVRDLPKPKLFEIHSARAFGLADLRIGHHSTQGEGDEEGGVFQLNFVWTLRIKPSFATHGFLTVATGKKSRVDGGKAIPWRRALLRSDEGEKLVSTNVPTTVEPLLKNVPIFTQSDTRSRDGIAYELIWQSFESRGAMQFSNPTNDVLRSLESTCHDLAVSLTKQSHDHKLFAFVKQWKRYIQQESIE